MDADRLPPLRETIRRHGLSARQGLGQHFLMDMNLNRRIVRAAGDLTGSDVLEVGPGPGGLTRALLESDARRVWAVERDDRCLGALQELADIAGERLAVLRADALTLDPAAQLGEPRHIVANLPYNIAAPLLVGWLHQVEAFAGITVMVQREMAERLTAPAGRKAYGRLSILAQWLSTPRIMLQLPPAAFTPPPKVASSVVHLAPRPTSEPDRQAVESVAAAAFQQRRKMLRSALQTLSNQPEALLEEAGVDPRTRADALPVSGYLALARAWQARTE